MGGVQPSAGLFWQLLWRGCSYLLLVGGSQRALTPGYRQQSWIKLDKRIVHSCMVGVAAIATGGGWNHLRGCCFTVAIEAKEGPLSGETYLVLHMRLDRHDAGALIIARLIYRALALGAASFDQQDRLV